MYGVCGFLLNVSGYGPVSQCRPHLVAEITVHGVERVEPPETLQEFETSTAHV